MSKEIKVSVKDKDGNAIDPRIFLQEGEFYNTADGGAFAIISHGGIPGANDYFPPVVHVENDDIPVYMGDTKVINANGIGSLCDESGKKVALIFISDFPFEIGNAINQDGKIYAVMSVTDYGLVTAVSNTVQRVEKTNFENE